MTKTLAVGDRVAYPSPAGGALGTIETVHYQYGHPTYHIAPDCTGTTYPVNPDCPEEGSDIRHDGPCTAHGPRVSFAASDVAALEPEPCGHCGRPMYYDDDDETYRHAVEPLRGCFLIPAHQGVAGYPIVDEPAAMGIGQ